MTMEYDAFISYASGVATPIARALRNGISKYNKKWNKAGSTKIYLDEKSSRVSSSLPAELAEELDRSRWLIVLLSRRAAEGHSWVDWEVRHWLKKDPSRADRILLVVCEGEISWEPCKGGDGEALRDGPGDFSVDTDCIPESLRGVFKSQPHWRDLSGFGSALDASDPRFQDCVIALYSTVHGMSPDEARMANDSNLRRNRRLAKGAIIALSALLVVSIIASIAALWQTQRARERERTALGLAMSAKARALVNENRRIASLLAVQAYRIAPSREAREALHEVAAGAPRLVRVDGLPARPTALTVPRRGDPLIGTEDGKVYRWVVEEGRFAHVLTIEAGSSSPQVANIRSSETGHRLLVQYGDPAHKESQQCLLWSVEESKEFDQCPVAAISPDGRTYIVDQTLYSEEGRNGEFRIGFDGLFDAAFSLDGRDFVLMRRDGTWQRRKVLAPEKTVDRQDWTWGDPGNRLPRIMPGGAYQVAHVGADDMLQVRRMDSAVSDQVPIGAKLTSPSVFGASPSGGTVFSAGGEGVYWVTRKRALSREAGASGEVQLEHLAGLSGIKLATMAWDSFLVGASDTHIAMWYKDRMPRITRSSGIVPTSGVIGGIWPYFSPNSEYVSFCYNGREGSKMLVVRVSDMHLLQLNTTACARSRWSRDGAYVAAEGDSPEHTRWFDVANGSPIDPVQVPQILIQPAEAQGEQKKSGSLELVQNGRELRVKDHADDAVLVRFVEPRGKTHDGQPLSGSVLSPDGRYFFSVSAPQGHKVKAGEEIQVWMLDTEEVIQTICRSAMTSLSPEEWAVAMPKVPVPETLACS